MRGNSRGRGGQNRETAAAVQLEPSPKTTAAPGGPSPGNSVDAAQVSIPGLSSEQVQRLLSLIDAPDTG